MCRDQSLRRIVDRYYICRPPEEYCSLRNRISRTNDQLTSGTPFEILSTRLTYQFAYHFAHCVSLSWLRFVDVIPWKTLTTEEGVACSTPIIWQIPFSATSRMKLQPHLGYTSRNSLCSSRECIRMLTKEAIDGWMNAFLTTINHVSNASTLHPQCSRISLRFLG